MIIKVDFRETAIIEGLENLASSYPDITLVTENLLIGDMAICNIEGKEVMIVERKTIADLAASIRDGRYKEQSHRLHNADIHNHYIYYLVEGNIRTFKPSRFGKRPITWKEVMSAMTSLSFHKGFSVHRTLDPIETCMWLMQTADKLRRSKEEPFYTERESVQKSSTDYIDVSKRAKKANIDESNIGAIMLAQIPGVSTTSAIAVMEKCGGIDKLIEYLKQDSNYLADISIPTKTGSSRRINKTCQSNIYNFLLSESTSTITIEDC